MRYKLNKKIEAVHVIFLVSFIAVLMVCSLAYHQYQSSYQESIDNAKNDLDRLAQIISGNVELSFFTIDQTLQRAAERQYFNLLFGSTLNADMEHNLSIWVNETPHIDAILFTDEVGVVDILFRKGKNNFEIKPGFVFSAKDHFKKHKESADKKLMISVLKSESNTYRIFVSRRIEKINGDFGGLVIAVMDGNYITNFFKSVEPEKDVNMSLFLDNDQLLINTSGDNEGLSMLKNIMKEANIAQSKAGEITTIEKFINNDFVLFSFEKLKTLPLTVSLRMNQQDIFANWYETRIGYIIFSFIFFVFVGTVSFFILMMEGQVKKIRMSEERAVMASQAKSDFLAKMSHELRTPLNAIIGFSEMLSSGYFGRVNNDQNDRLKDVNMCGNHLLDLINDILDFSKGEAGKMELSEEEIDLRNIVDKAFRVVDQKARSSGVSLVNAVPKDIPLIYVDERKIRQILINLLSNAVKFTKEDGKVIISAHFNPEKHFVITVSDTGIGMKSEDIPKALALFEQVHDDDNCEGTGLGLPLCKMFAELHEGTLEIESQPGIGTKISIILPKERVVRSVLEKVLMS